MAQGGTLSRASARSQLVNGELAPKYMHISAPIGENAATPSPLSPGEGRRRGGTGGTGLLKLMFRNQLAVWLHLSQPRFHLCNQGWPRRLPGAPKNCRSDNHSPSSLWQFASVSDLGSFPDTLQGGAGGVFITLILQMRKLGPREVQRQLSFIEHPDDRPEAA